MHIRKNLPAHWLDRSQPILATFIVLGPGHSSSIAGFHAGRIKTVLFGPNVVSPLLIVQPIMRDGRMIGVDGMNLTAAEVEKGTMFLRDMYAAEGRLDDYARYVAREQAIRAGKMVEPLDEFDPRLPAQVVEWRRARGVKDSFVWDAPPTAASSLAAASESWDEIPEVQPSPAPAPATRRQRSAASPTPEGAA